MPVILMIPAAGTCPMAIVTCMGGTHLTATEPAMADEAFALVRAGYERARRANAWLPALDPAHEGRLRERVERAVRYGGVAAMRDGALRGFMVAGPAFEFRGAHAALVPEFAFALADGDAPGLIGELYARVAEALVERGAALHLVAHLSMDAATTSALYQLGFGAVVCERLRGVSDVVVPRGLRGVHHERLERVERLASHAPLEPLAALAARHAAYYRQSPVFVVKDDGHATALAELETHRDAGDALFLVVEAGEPQAYLIVGPCAGVTEGRLLEGTSTAQVRSAYTAPEARGRGMGTALLQHAVRWARDQGYERLLVEHESANLPAVAFWQRHFDAYLSVSMRSVDARLVHA